MNLPSFVKRTSAFDRQAAGQLGALHAAGASNDTVFTVTMNEPLEELRLHPFDRLNRSGNVRPIWMIDPINKDVARWPNRFARLAEASWAKGRGVWVEKFALASRPADSLLWVEGDTPNVHWPDVPGFFSRIDFDREIGGPNGFVRVARSAGNKARFQALAAASQEETPRHASATLHGTGQ